jgi:hypothetical protein
MPSIGLITTGKCEHRALASSLQQVLGGGGGNIVRSLGDHHSRSITSHPLTDPAPLFARTLIDDLVNDVVAAFDERDAPDFVFAIDDLELANTATPENVTRFVADGVRRYILRETRTHRELARVRERCSFHLLCPMLETYFFGEPDALRRAGVTRPAILDTSRHLEEFRATDLAFIVPGDVQGHDWRTPDRARHPKRYLKFLSDPDDTKPVASRYREGRDGAKALATLDWAQVFAYQPPGIAFAYSLFDDLADALGMENPFPGTCHPLTMRRAGGTLRNLL